MRIAIAAALLTLVALVPLARAADAAAAAGYLFVTFKGEKTPLTEQICFATSVDGRHWTALNDAEPTLVSWIGERGVRDPYLVRTPAGKFVLIATDLSIALNHDWKRAGRQGSKSIVIWEGNDLVHWSTPRLAAIAPPDAGCTWAPQAIYDEKAGDYLVYWSALTAADEFKKFRIWSCRTKDFRTFGPPSIYIDKPFATIDTDIVRDGNAYYRFTKDEQNAAITMERADALDGTWTDVAGYTLGLTKGYEGPACFQLAPTSDGKPGGWCLLLDHFTKGLGYEPYVTRDLASGKFEPAGDFHFPYRFRHGHVLPITAAELERLQTAYPSTRPTTQP